MFKFYTLLLSALLISSVLSATAFSADEQVIIDTDEKAKELFLGFNWKCEWKDKYFSGIQEIVYEEASLKKVTGKD